MGNIIVSGCALSLINNLLLLPTSRYYRTIVQALYYLRRLNTHEGVTILQEL